MGHNVSKLKMKIYPSLNCSMVEGFDPVCSHDEAHAPFRYKALDSTASSHGFDIGEI